MGALVESGGSTTALRELAVGAGMRTLAESALGRLRSGETRLAEVLRVLGIDFWLDLARVVGQAVPQEVQRAR